MVESVIIILFYSTLAITSAGKIISKIVYCI